MYVIGRSYPAGSRDKKPTRDIPDILFQREHFLLARLLASLVSFLASTMGSLKRISKELAELTESPPAGITVQLVDEADVYKWKVFMKGPQDTPYQVQCTFSGHYISQFIKVAGQDGTFLVNLTLPNEYPFKPPTVSFATKIYHPNVSNDDKGSMCLGMLKSDEWKPSSRIAAVLEFARQLLVEPMPDDAVEGRIAEQYQNDRKRFEEVARDWTRRFAKGEK
ncbi:hypothetical protein UA08_04029 [Talaromyces atroroseus]|uniref:E2 ubiquitin-conjugating enzyme n=1 Tax=Talaromyces atroroseus TaxID=1441469 RepID=A0A1Q5Q953_TALAT|nr:hypothetical protein UA08_04029 [Talaromyces atroroseus]OKL60663.1 hypothetical protein UA08_04029 [Talaromyces atroroseus]